VKAQLSTSITPVVVESPEQYDSVPLLLTVRLTVIDSGVTATPLASSTSITGCTTRPVPEVPAAGLVTNTMFTGTPVILKAGLVTESAPLVAVRVTPVA
jgi:hypothetical protein